MEGRLFFRAPGIEIRRLDPSCACAPLRRGEDGPWSSARSLLVRALSSARRLAADGGRAGLPPPPFGLRRDFDEALAKSNVPLAQGADDFGTLVSVPRVLRWVFSSGENPTEPADPADSERRSCNSHRKRRMEGRKGLVSRIDHFNLQCERGPSEPVEGGALHPRSSVASAVARKIHPWNGLGNGSGDATRPSLALRARRHEPCTSEGAEWGAT
jgi:hypothetical protein